MLLVWPALWCLQRTVLHLHFLRHEQLQQQRLTLNIVRLKRQQQHLLLTLAAADGKALPKASAGQHLLLFGQDAQGRPVSRAYSLASNCRQRRYYRLAIKAEPGGRLSPQLYQSLAVGQQLTSSTPRGHFLLARSRRPLVLVAAGVGITPMLAMAYQAIVQRRNVTLLYQARTGSHLLYHRLLSRLPGLRYLPQLSQADANWAGAKGRVSAEQLLSLAGGEADFYCCASAAMTEQLKAQFAALGIRRFYFELFSAAASNSSFNLRFQHIEADSAGYSSVLDALNAAGANIRSDCRSGSCGLCKLQLVSGEIEQILQPATPCQKSEVLACCIQAKSDLLLA